jgi:hypothetical protein
MQIRTILDSPSGRKNHRCYGQTMFKTVLYIIHPSLHPQRRLQETTQSLRLTCKHLIPRNISCPPRSILSYVVKTPHLQNPDNYRLRPIKSSELQNIRERELTTTSEKQAINLKPQLEIPPKH